MILKNLLNHLQKTVSKTKEKLFDESFEEKSQLLQLKLETAGTIFPGTSDALANTEKTHTLFH